MSIRQGMYTQQKQGRKSLAVLLDPDKTDAATAQKWARHITEAGADYIFVGGSLLMNREIEQVVPALKSASSLPVILFPGSVFQVVDNADAILFLSLISGRNPEMLIGNHVQAAPMVRASGLEVLPTGYLLIESGKTTAAHYMSGTQPIPADKPDIAACTAMAGEMLGLQLLYLDAGSGAAKPVSSEMIRQVTKSVSIPVIVGGGVRSAEDAERIYAAGADMIVVGSAFETDPDGQLIAEIATICAKYTENVPG